MKKQFTGLLICLGLTLILLGNFIPLSFAQTKQEQCEDYEICSKSNGMIIRNDFFGLTIKFDTQTGLMTVDFNPAYSDNFKIREGKRRVGFIDNFCGAKFIANNFEKPLGTVGQYTVKNDKKPVEFDFTLTNFRDDCRNCTNVDIQLKFGSNDP